jgi:hypothetical protein
VLAQESLSTPATAGVIAAMKRENLGYRGSLNTAMSLSIDAGVANILERVNIGAYLGP